ncbi:FlgB family protein [Loktanella sp. F6476L]|uniref:FlgB family protein n=1 Tax=Loktanella sp. F6476L TaxID=2926405 RepID=UPI001FF3382D|nr:FlgB family protein [Loktanella sp. F6476L]MCK0120415.1 FlgB family protein [Loktanella sp. F6476L]
MYQNLDLFQTSGAMARHAGSRQAVVAQNIANADTPGFRALQVPSFSEAVKNSGVGAMKMTRSNHLHGDTKAAVVARVIESAAEPAPNGNSVSIEDEMLHSVEVTREHSRALAIYRHGLTVIRATLGR